MMTRGRGSGELGVVVFHLWRLRLRGRRRSWLLGLMGFMRRGMIRKIFREGGTLWVLACCMMGEHNGVSFRFDGQEKA